MEEAGSVIAQVLALAGAQSGVVTTRQCIELGLARNSVMYRVREGLWRRIHRGCVVVTPGPITPLQLEVAALLLAGDGACLSHFSAARRLGLSIPRTEGIFITVPLGRTVRGIPWATFYRSDIHPNDAALRKGIALTRVGLTLLQLSSMLAPEWLRAAVDSAIRLRPSNLSWAQYALQRYRGYSGAAKLRRLLADYAGDVEIPDSTLESLAQELCFVSGKRPILHHTITDSRGGFIAEVDYAWPPVRLAIELDSWQWHAAQRRDFEETQRRRRRVELAGWEVHAFGWNDVIKRRDEMIAELTEFHRRREHSLRCA